YGSRDNVFFEERFCAVHQRLEQAEWADPAGSPAILDSTDELALKEHGVGDGHEKHDRDYDDLEHAPQEKLQNRHVPKAFRKSSTCYRFLFYFGLMLFQVANAFAVPAQSA